MHTLIEQILNRRSVKAGDLNEPGPSSNELETILRAAHRVPDHGKLGPWRFIIFQDKARSRFGQILAETFKTENPDTSAESLQFEAQRFTRAPVVIGVVATSVDHPKIPIWEQQLSVGACCQNILLSAHSMGYGAQWLTEWYSYSETIAQALSLKVEEKLAGFIYIGSYKDKPPERKRPDLEERIYYWE